MKQRFIAAAAVLAVAAGSLVACSSNAGSSDDTTLTLWHNSADSPALLQLYKDFEAETGIKVELVPIPADSFETTTQTKFATGDRPDVMEYQPNSAGMATLNPAENMQDLSDMEFVQNSGDLYESVGTYNGKVYSAVTGFPSIFGIFYNKNVFADNGLEPPQSFGDLESSCEALTSVGITPIWEAGGSAWPTQVLPILYLSDVNQNDEYGLELASNKTPLNDPDGQFVKALEVYEGLSSNECFNSNATSATFEDGLRAVYDGTAAMTALHSDTYAALLADAGGDADLLSQAVGFTPVSATSPVAAFAGSPLGSFFAPKTGDEGRENAARQFIEYATGKGYQKYIDDAVAFPVINTAKTPDGFSQLQLDFQSAYENGATVAFNSNIVGINGFSTETSKLLAGQTTPQGAADSLQAQVEQGSKQAGIPGW